MGKQLKQWHTLFWGLQKSLQMVTVPMKLKDACSLEWKLWNLGSILKSRDITLPKKICLVKAMVFPVVMYGYELDYKESQAAKNWCFWTVVLEKTLESPLDYKEIQPVHPKANQPWIYIGRTDAEAEAPILHLMQRTDSLEKTLMLGKIADRKRRGRQTMRGLDGITSSMNMSLSKLREVVKWQGNLVCCSPWGCKESDMTEQLNNNNSNPLYLY